MRSKLKIPPMGRSISQITTATVLIGSVSYFFNLVVVRNLTTVDAARIMTSWTVINIFLLVVQFPLELYAPRLLRAMAARGIHDLFTSLVIVFISVSALLTMLLFFGFFVLRFTLVFSELWVFALLICSLSIFQINRTIDIARENLGSLQVSALLLSIASGFGLIAVGLARTEAPWAPLSVVILGYWLSSLRNLRSLDFSCSSVRVVVENRRSLKSIFSLKEVGVLSLGNLVSLLLVPGGSLFTGVVGLSYEETVLFLSSTAIVLIPITILNSTSMPVYLKAIRLHHEGGYVELKRFALRTTIVYGAVLLIMLVIFHFVGEMLLRIYVGQSYEYRHNIFLGCASAVSLAFISAIPRTFLMAVGRVSRTARPLAFSFCVYVALIFTIRNGFVGLFASSIASSLLIGVLCLILLRNHFQSLEKNS